MGSALFCQPRSANQLGWEDRDRADYASGDDGSYGSAANERSTSSSACRRVALGERQTFLNLRYQVVDVRFPPRIPQFGSLTAREGSYVRG